MTMGTPTGYSDNLTGSAEVTAKPAHNRAIEIEPCQCRAARAVLNWSANDLAANAGVGRSTVADFERGARRPVTNNLRAIYRALTEAGIVMVGDAARIGIRWTDGGNDYEVTMEARH